MRNGNRICNSISNNNCTGRAVNQCSGDVYVATSARERGARLPHDEWSAKQSGAAATTSTVGRQQGTTVSVRITFDESKMNGERSNSTTQHAMRSHCEVHGNNTRRALCVRVQRADGMRRWVAAAAPPLPVARRNKQRSALSRAEQTAAAQSIPWQFYRYSSCRRSQSIP